MYLRSQTKHLTVRLAATAADLDAVQRLRYNVFVAEGGASGPDIDHEAARERDRFDAFADHLLLIDPTRPARDEVVGTYRLMTEKHAEAAGSFYSAGEYDLSKLLSNGGRVLELGRTCLDPVYRGGAALVHLWQGIGRYVDEHQIDTLFGAASFPGTNPEAVAQALSLLHHLHRARPDIRAAALGPDAIALDLMGADGVDRRKAMIQMPPLIKSYLRVGGAIGDGAFIDHTFNTIDVCMILETAKLSARQRALYGG